MIKTISAVLILLSFGASIYYSVVGVIKPETTVVYNKANMTHLGIQLLSVFLGIGGLLLLFQQTFKVGGIILAVHSVITIICYIIIKDWRGGIFEFLFLQIPVFLLWIGYPIEVLEKIKKIV